MKIATFEYTNPMLKGLSTYLSEKDSRHADNYIRVSEYIEVEFPPRAAEEIVPEQIAALDTQIAEVTDKFGKALAELKARKSELLAISAPEVVQ